MISDKIKIAILGSTGSIGKQTIEIILKNRDLFEVVLISAKSNIDLLYRQIKSLNPTYCVVDDVKVFKLLSQNSNIKNTSIKHSASGYIECVEKLDKIDVTVSAISGFAGAYPTVLFTKISDNIALANKESIICCGNIIKKYAKLYNTNIVPVDSEHNSIYNILLNKKRYISKYIITASGGPFYKRDNFDNITFEDALKHPNWSMGVKNTIDSATLVNKGIEIIELAELFECSIDSIDAVIHPQSIIHGMVSFEDGQTHAILSNPDMKVYIGNAILGDSFKNKFTKQLDPLEIRSLDFYPIDKNKFPSVELAKMCYKKGKSHVVAFNSIDEVLVDLFSKGKISFKQIFDILINELALIPAFDIENLDDIITFHKEIQKEIYLKLS